MGDLTVYVCVGGGPRSACHEPQSVSEADLRGEGSGLGCREGGTQEMIKAQVKSLIELSFRLISLLPLLA